MDIQTAVHRTFAALDFDEKTLGLVSSKQHHDSPGTFWIRDSVLSLQETLKTTCTEAKQHGFEARFINLYCDTLIVEPGASIGCPDSPFHALNIYARDIQFTPGTDNVALRVTMEENSAIVFHTRTIPPDFRVSFNIANTVNEDIRTPEIPPGMFSILFLCDDQMIVSETHGPPDTAMKFTDYLSLIGEDGRLSKNDSRDNDHLPRLLQLQLLVALAHVHSHRDLALSLLDFIRFVSATSYSSWLSCYANAIYCNLSSNLDVSYVPSLNVHSSQQVLISRLAAASSFEDAFRDFMSRQTNADYQVTSMYNMLAKSQGAMETFDFLKSIRTRDFNEATGSNNQAKLEFEKNQEELITCRDRFEKGIDTWLLEEQIEAGWEVLKATVGAAVAIGVACSSGGATAPAAAGAVQSAADAATSVSKLQEIWAKIKKIFETLKSIYNRIAPILQGLWKLVKSISTVVKNLKRSDKASQTALLEMTIEFKARREVNVLAEWDKFYITVKDMEDELKSLSIDGKTAFFHALKTLVVNGKCYITTQATLLKQGDKLATALVQGRVNSQQTDRLERSFKQIKVDKEVLEYVSRAFFDRVLRVRILAYLDLNTYSAVHRYHTLFQQNLEDISPISPVGVYQERVAHIQRAIASFESTTPIQNRIFQVSSLCGYRSSQDLAQALTSHKAVGLDLDPQASIWQRFGRIRMLAARCYLDGLQLVPGSDPSAPALQLHLSTSSQFSDRGTDLHNEVYSFSGNPRTLVFEYDVGNGTILCDGNYGTHTKYTPMTQWSVVIPREIPLDHYDFSNLRSLRFEFLCEFSLQQCDDVEDQA
ncbi:uncharacterized protein BO80DRAFT_462499 [Aspergillus ibericus CBS 121593]|uniref:Uncharacterized protein n=1 Tax=Aspergillus ibericus CBS 121593 TaxID=1448316 RepID=A0A395HC53_9EURO|nr:hypothetical protein BO80DRAFT_462499 [Aspergillus ibericus CBS 121593]RAL03814.1 hypothetical protein BO80DRAFT_462499 [Aspergillus ibericus CBS 121593]